MEGIQVRPVVAYVGVALVATLMVLDGLRTAPKTVYVTAPSPMEFSFEQQPGVLVGAVLDPRPAAPAPRLGTGSGSEAAPVLTVPAVVQSAISSPAPAPAPPVQAGPQAQPAAPQAGPPAAQPAGPPAAQPAAQPAPVVATPQAAHPGPGNSVKGKDKGKGKGKGQASQDGSRGTVGDPAKGKGKGKAKGRRG